MKTEDLLAELERYIFVILKELKDSRPIDYEHLRSLFPSIPRGVSVWNGEDRTNMYVDRKNMALVILGEIEKQGDLLVFIEGALSRRYFMEADDAFFPEKKKQLEFRRQRREELKSLEYNQFSALGEQRAQARAETLGERRTENEQNRQAGPSLARMAGNFIGAMGAYAKDGFRNVTKEQHGVRQAICNGCEFWDGKARMGAGKCMKCGCSGAKLWMASSECPIKKWGKEEAQLVPPPEPQPAAQ